MAQLLHISVAFKYECKSTQMSSYDTVFRMTPQSSSASPEEDTSQGGLDVPVVLRNIFVWEVQHVLRALVECFFDLFYVNVYIFNF